jgi:hypothetical protein
VPVVDKDYVVRLVKQFADLFARIVKLIERKEYEQALRALQAACPAMVGFDYAPLAFADAASAARILTSRDKVKAFAQLVTKEAEILELKEDSTASDKRRFALELWAEAAARGAPLDPALIATVRTLRDRVGAESLSPTHQEALAKALPLSPA